MSLRPCSDLVRPLLKHPCFISARIKNALHNLSLPLKPPTSLSLCTIFFLIHRQHFHFCHHCKSKVHYPIPVGAAACPAHYPDFLHFHKHRQPHHHRHPTLSITSHRPISNSRHRRNHNYSLFIFHHSSFIIFAANPAIPTITATLHYPSPRTIKNQNPRRR